MRPVATKCPQFASKGFLVVIWTQYTPKGFKALRRAARGLKRQTGPPTQTPRTKRAVFFQIQVFPIFFRDQGAICAKGPQFASKGFLVVTWTQYTPKGFKALRRAARSLKRQTGPPTQTPRTKRAVFFQIQVFPIFFRDQGAICAKGPQFASKGFLVVI